MQGGGGEGGAVVSLHRFILTGGVGEGGGLLQNADSSAAAWSRSLKSYLGQFQNYSPQISALCTLLAGHNFDKPAEESFDSHIQCNSDQNVPAQFLILYHLGGRQICPHRL